jgi:hypothetical protein
MPKWLRKLFVWHTWIYGVAEETRKCQVCGQDEIEHYHEDEFLGMGSRSYEPIVPGNLDLHFVDKNSTKP